MGVKILPYLILILLGGYIVYDTITDVPFDASEYHRKIIAAEQAKRSALTQRDLAIKARDKAIAIADREIEFRKENEVKQTENHKSHEKYINKHIVLASADSLLLTGKALSDSINRIGYGNSNPY
jgi:hypothetical protein